MTLRRLFFVVSSAALLAGCESVGDVVNKHRSAVQKVFGELQALGPKVKTLEPLTEAKVKTPTPLVLEGPGANAMFVYAEDLAKPGDALPVHLRTIDSLPLLQCGALLEKGQYFADSITRTKPSVVDAYLSDCARLRYALIIVEREFKQPELTLITRSFTSGLYRADVLVFDLADGAFLGGYPMSAKNDDSVSLFDADPDHRQRLLSNLESTIFNSLRDGARAALPGSLPAKPK